jgi:hypothetical protein
LRQLDSGGGVLGYGGGEIIRTTGGTNQGVFIMAFESDIHAMMLELELQNGRTDGHQLEEIDLSSCMVVP